MLTCALAHPHNYSRMFTRIGTASEHMQRARAPTYTFVRNQTICMCVCLANQLCYTYDVLAQDTDLCVCVGIGVCVCVRRATRARGGWRHGPLSSDSSPAGDAWPYGRVPNRIGGTTCLTLLV